MTCVDRWRREWKQGEPARSYLGIFKDHTCPPRYGERDEDREFHDPHRDPEALEWFLFVRGLGPWNLT
jgi:hypothetical protein